MSDGGFAPPMGGGISGPTGGPPGGGFAPPLGAVFRPTENVGGQASVTVQPAPWTETPAAMQPGSANTRPQQGPQEPVKAPFGGVTNAPPLPTGPTGPANLGSAYDTLQYWASYLPGVSTDQAAVTRAAAAGAGSAIAATWVGRGNYKYQIQGDGTVRVISGPAYVGETYTRNSNTEKYNAILDEYISMYPSTTIVGLFRALRGTGAADTLAITTAALSNVQGGAGFDPGTGVAPAGGLPEKGWLASIPWWVYVGGAVAAVVVVGGGGAYVYHKRKRRKNPFQAVASPEST